MSRPTVLVTAEPPEWAAFLDEARQDGKQVGLHLTMGALHAGHRANIRRAAAECDVVGVTIFVNPLQFGPHEDFGAYPRDLAGDTAQAEEAGADIVLAPGTTSMYPEEPLVTVRVKRLGEILEGRQRPGHFDGVATIVTKFLALSGPCRAYFGEKDFQQLVIVRQSGQRPLIAGRGGCLPDGARDRRACPFEPQRLSRPRGTGCRQGALLVLAGR